MLTICLCIYYVLRESNYHKKGLKGLNKQKKRENAEVLLCQDFWDCFQKDGTEKYYVSIITLFLNNVAVEHI